MKRIRTLVIDDEALARKRILKLLQHDSEIEILGECANGHEAVKQINEHKPDLVFLDVQMPGLSGFEVLSNISIRKMPMIIFVTAYDKYALKAFEVHAIDYLLKPFDDERFQEALNYAKDYLAQSSDHLEDQISSLLSDLKSTVSPLSNGIKYIDRIVIKSAGKINFVKTDNIIRIRADGKYLEILTAEGKFLHRQTMNDIETKLDPKKFLRIHRSTILNIDSIKEMQNWQKGEFIIILKNGEKFTSGHSYRKNIEEVLYAIS